eukprot:3331019-Pleurochrysis_carterae.AAC.1
MRDTEWKPSGHTLSSRGASSHHATFAATGVSHTSRKRSSPGWSTSLRLLDGEDGNESAVDGGANGLVLKPAPFSTLRSPAPDASTSELSSAGQQVRTRPVRFEIVYGTLPEPSLAEKLSSELRSVAASDFSSKRIE